MAIKAIDSNMTAVEALAAINTNFTDIAQSLAALDSTANATRRALITQGVPVTESVKEGSIVYFDAEKATFAPALAKFETTADGTSTAAPCAQVAGIIIDIDSSGILGTLLHGGSYKDATVVTNCLGDSAASGIYYLSGSVAGMASSTPPVDAPKIPVLINLGDGEFLVPMTPLGQEGHMHASLQLRPEGWVGAIPDGVPAAYIKTYKFTEEELNAIGGISAETTAIFINGVLTAVGPEHALYIKDNSELWARASVLETSTIVLFNYFPFGYDTPVVRSIKSSDDSRLQIENSYGNITLKPRPFEKAAGAESSGLAVADIAGAMVKYTPIVSRIQAGPGASVMQLSNGVYSIGLSNYVDTLLDAYSINFNGALQATSDLLTYIIMPKGRASSIITTLPVAGYSGKYTASVWCIINGANSPLAVECVFIPNAVSDIEQALKTNSIDTTVQSSSAASGSLQYKEATSSIEIEGDGLLIAKISAGSAAIPVADTNILRTGFILRKTKEATDPSDTAVSIVGDAVSVVAFRAIAAEIIEAGTCVMADPYGGIAPCDASSADTADSCIGIAIKGAEEGGECEIATSGVISISGGTTLNPGTRLYIGTDGVLTDDPSNLAYKQAVGLVLGQDASGANTITIAISSAVISMDNA